MKPKITLPMFLLGAFVLPCSAQPAFDSSGDGLLNGAYYLRQVFYFVTDQAGDITDAINIQGTITFNGSGTYSFSGSFLDGASGSSTPQTYTTTGTYVISASGLGYISTLDPTDFSGDQVLGLVSHGIFIGSSTENANGYNDMLVAAPIGSTATNATLKGTYSVAYLDPTYPGDALFTMSADGNGNIGNVNVTEYLGTNSSASTGTLSGVKYSFSNGAAQINFGGKANGGELIEGTELLYISPDGNFIFGGNYNGFDMFVGVRAATSNPSNYDGLYYQAGIDLSEATVSSGYSLLFSYYGSLQAYSGAEIVGHQRENSLLYYGGTSDYTYYDSYQLNGDGSSDDSLYLQHYISSQDGAFRIGYGIGPYLGLNVAIQAPSLSGSGVYLSPVGVVNAASSAPFTAFVSPGEFLTLYGSGLSSDTVAASVPFPTMLNGVQVMINGRPAPIYYVSATQISVIVPYFTESVAQIQVVNNGAKSNIVTQFVGMTSAGIFTNNPVGGTGYAAALHPDYSLITTSSPAQIGETVAVYLTGMGAVTPSVADGVAAPISPLSMTTTTPYVLLWDATGNPVQATNVTFSGLAPGFAGLYQIDFTIPSGLASGDASLEIFGPDSDTFECLLPIGSGTATANAMRAKPAAAKRPVAHRILPPRLLRLNASQR
ncbi:MAG TPA: IPT/TIG domain-containing protein [Bryobacteraceae bacterium]|nr:IPT/TIG domain-containing protein [Bryobacteraceae bacterium]